MLGKSGLSVSEIGFGCWGIGGDHEGAIAYGPTRDRDSLQALHCAFDRGINFFDTSDFYGHGHSERLLGKAFKSNRSNILIASKGGMGHKTKTGNWHSTYLQTALENTLQRLGTDYVDLYQLHSPSLQDLELHEDVFSLLEKFKTQGKIRAYGISVRSPDEGLEVIQKYPCSCLQVNFSLIDQRALDNGLLELCAERQIGVIGRTPLCFGYLTGRYTGKEKLPESDHRSRWGQAQIDQWIAAQNRIFSLISHPEETPAQFALRFCLSYQAVSTVIPGMLFPSHVNENCMASHDGPLPPDTLAKIRFVYRQQQDLLTIRK
jgi:aryl-alcohol dehydrogenase-like predicted oxidoreductase